MSPTPNTLISRVRAQPLALLWILFALAAFVSYVVPLLWLLQVYVNHGKGAMDMYDRDFANYWVAGRLVLSGDHLTLFTHDVYYAHLKSIFGSTYQVRSWSYPPHYLLLVFPLGFLGYGAALAAFLASTFALFAASALEFRRRFAPDASLGLCVLALFGYVAMMIDATQNGFLTAALMLTALAFMRSRPWLAGLALAVLTVKPQLGLLFAIVVVLDKNWRTLGWTAAFAAAFVGLSVLFFGLESWAAYFREVIPYQRFVMTNWNGIFLNMMPSVFGSLRSLGFAPSTAIAAHVVLAIVALPVLIWMLVKIREPLPRMFVLLVGTFIVTPYAYNYDMGAVSVVAALLALTPAMRERRGATLCAALVAVLPGIMANLGRSDLPIAPLLLASAVLAIGGPKSRSTDSSR